MNKNYNNVLYNNNQENLFNENIFITLDAWHENYWRHSGRIISCADGILVVDGITNVQSGELVLIQTHISYEETSSEDFFNRFGFKLRKIYD